MIFIGLTAFFVASEFAIVKVRSSRIDQLVEEGHPLARSAKRVISNLDEYLSACQLGITITALALGWIGESTVADLLGGPLASLGISENLSHVISIAIAFTVITFLHVVIGELAPKTVAIQKAERLTLLLSKPLIFFYRLMYPIIWLLNGSARFVVRLFGLKNISEHDIAHTEEELRLIVTESYRSGEINQSEFKYVNKIFEFDDRIAKEIMVPRTEIVTLDKNDTMETFLQLAKEERYTRYPVMDGDKDHIIGMINVKQIFIDVMEGKKITSFEPYIRPIIRVIDSIPINELLVRLQRERVHMAILSDEYGGTSGLVTVEDIIEEIVGEIRDEFDADEVPLVQTIEKDHYVIDGKVLVSEVNELLGTSLDDSDVDTLGGWVLTHQYESQGSDIIRFEDVEFIVKEMDEHQIKYVEVRRVEQEDESTVEVKTMPTTTNQNTGAEVLSN
ncbi:hemolysin family protein [Mangrovibacillus cuniculi]|uniref:HlyC/CorC family transporter n=1 Tax=Mangrovibacillus cuniculi TaxID=2593652 RepID=A0A7S8HGY4_9BACI|nr:hemolysin family protein [Mangrovibacillus cuniculi]QPC48484.1 HlyC/CorC family transporter [Mangrovibacillus cuniculi]